jgi:hypothetical protein
MGIMKTKIGFKVAQRALEEKTIAIKGTQRPFEENEVTIGASQRSLVDITSAIGSTLPWFEPTAAQGQVTAERSIW